MTDLLVVLPHFPTDKYAHLLPVLEKNQITTADLLTLDSVDLAKKARPLTIGDAKSLSNAVQEALRKSLGISENNEVPNSSLKKRGSQDPATTVSDEKREISLRKTGSQVVDSWSTISTLSKDLDIALGGGIPTGYITEVTGERSKCFLSFETVANNLTAAQARLNSSSLSSCRLNFPLLMDLVAMHCIYPPNRLCLQAGSRP